MSEDSQGIIAAAFSVAEVDGLIRSKFGVDTKVVVPSDEFSWIFFNDPETNQNRKLTVFDGQKTNDYKEVYDGPRMLISMGANGRGPEFIRTLVEHWGGWFCASDASDEWAGVQRVVEENVEPAPLPPDAVLRIELSDALGDKQQALVHALADLARDDVEGLTQVRAAVDRFLETVHTPTVRP